MRSHAAIVGALASFAQAQRFSTQCFSGNVCYSLNIPEETARSGSGEIFFQISAPSSFSWVALGQGTSMTGSSMFVVYSDGRGNVTLSPRRGTGHVEPAYSRVANVTLLEGSGVMSDRMVANVLCSNCERWDGGWTDFTSSSGSWIFASRTGSPLDSSELDATIEQHQDADSFTWDYTSAKGGNSPNPFVAQSATNGSSTPTGGVSAAPSSPSSGDTVTTDSSSSNSNMILLAHGTLASVAFLALFPLGAAMIRIPGLCVWIHGVTQLFSYVCFIAASGLGIWYAVQNAELDNAHPIIGLVVLGVLFFQPLGGLLHHAGYKKVGRRTAVSYFHVWAGRAAVILGIINGGLGIQLADDVKRGYIIAYGVVAGVMGVFFIAVGVWGEVAVAKRKGNAVFDMGRKDESSPS